MGWIHNVIKIIILSIIIFFIILNIRDYFAVKHEQYGKIKLQLPVKLKKFNHNMIKKISKVESLNLIILISFILGVVISLGEFMCTGQIYLTTIITVLQTSAYFNLRAFVYLIIYNIAFVLPFFVVLLIIYRGKGIFEISDIITQKLSLIKILNTIIFLALGIYVILN